MSSIQTKPELVAPAGDWSTLASALEAGCDAVYFGLKGLNMREQAANFDILELRKLIRRIHKQGRKGYLALNVIIYDAELAKLRRILIEAKAAGIDAVILWDLAAFVLAKELGLRVHLSTQASVANNLAVRAYQALGVERIVLARECRLSDIRQIIRRLKAQAAPCAACQIEAFVHGAMCLSISGRCFLSEYSFSQSANRGSCIQPCRHQYRIIDASGECEYILGDDYLLSPRDLCALGFLDKLIEAGIHAFKIEGRARSPEYVKVVTSAYRRAIDAYYAHRLDSALKERLRLEVSRVYNRGFSSGFYWGKPQLEASQGLENTYEKVYVGDVLAFYKKIGVAEVMVRNEALRKGDLIVCVGKSTPASFATVTDIQINHVFVDRVDRGRAAGVKLPFIAKHGDKIFIWRQK